MTTPERRRATRRPKRRPETTIESAVARRCAGARSPTRGSTVGLSAYNHSRHWECVLTQLRSHSRQGRKIGEEAEHWK